MPHHKPTNAEAWERFESDYSPPQKSPSTIKRQIESTKYGLDTAVFAVDRFTKNVEDQADFSFDQGSLRRTRANFCWRVAEQPAREARTSTCGRAAGRTWVADHDPLWQLTRPGAIRSLLRNRLASSRKNRSYRTGSRRITRDSKKGRY